MSDEYDNNKSYQAQSSETMGGSAPVSPDIDYVRPAEIPEQELYHGHTFLTKWVFCQDAKVIGCLLYTSPSPRDKRQSRMPSSA